MSWRYALRNDRYTSSIGDRYSTHYHKSPSRLDSSTEATTGRQLQRVLHHSISPCRAISSLRTKCTMHDVDCDEVYPGVFIGDAAAAKNKMFLRDVGITHVLNAAEGIRWGQVDTGHAYYRDMQGLRYMGFPLSDSPSTDISRYFYVAAKFIDSAVSSGGRVLVHCLVGVSRSATCVLAYLMIYRRMSAVDAIRTVAMRRPINPNDGFLQQLADLDISLRRQSMYSQFY